MSPIEPKPGIEIQRPQGYVSLPCPFCGVFNKVPRNGVQTIFVCSSCGKQVDLRGEKPSSSN